MIVDIESLQITCHSCPAQFEGKLDNGLFFYGRSRYRAIRISIAYKMEDAIRGGTSMELDAHIGRNKYDCCTVEELRKVFEAWLSIISWDG